MTFVTLPMHEVEVLCPVANPGNGQLSHNVWMTNRDSALYS